MADDAGAIALVREPLGTTRIGHGAVLGRGLLREKPDPRKAAFDLAECDEDLLPVARDGFFVGGLGAFEVRLVSPAGENRQ